jgi:hypothetical protein
MVSNILSLERTKTQLTDYDVQLSILHQRVRCAAATSNGNPFSQPPVELCKFHIFTLSDGQYTELPSVVDVPTNLSLLCDLIGFFVDSKHRSSYVGRYV